MTNRRDELDGVVRVAGPARYFGEATRNSSMSISAYSVIELIDQLLETIPGPQQNEKITEYKTRTSNDALTVLRAVMVRKAETDTFIEDHSETDAEEEEQVFDAVRNRFVVVR